MSIVGIGTDIVQISRIEGILERFNDRFAKRILTEDELQVFYNTKQQARFLAKRFAVKEAVAKALGTGFSDNVLMTQIGVKNDKLGKPVLEFYGKTKNFVESLDVSKYYVSISDEAIYALAFVVLVEGGT